MSGFSGQENCMSKELTDLQDLRSAFISHCRALGCDADYIKVCENKFNKIEASIAIKEKMTESLQSSKEHLIDDLEEALANNEAILKENAFYKKLLKDYRHVSEKKILELKTNLSALDTIKNCIVGEFELKDNCDTDNAFNSPYRFRIYIDDITFNEWILKNKEEYDTLKEALKYE